MIAESPSSAVTYLAHQNENDEIGVCSDCR